MPFPYEEEKNTSTVVSGNEKGSLREVEATGLDLSIS